MLRTIQLLSKVLEDFLMVLIVEDLHSMVVQLLPCKLILDPSHTFHCAWKLTHTTPQWFLNAWKRFTISLPPLSIRPRFWTLSRTGFPMLVKKDVSNQNSDPILDAPSRMKHPNSRREIDSRSNLMISNMLVSVSSFFEPSFLSSPRHGVRLLNLKKMAARQHRENHDFEQTKMMTFHITRESTFGQHVSKSVLGVNIFDLDFGVQIDSVQEPIQRNHVSSGHVSHHRTSAFDDHFLTPLHYLRTYTTDLHTESNLRL